ncbi:MAG: vitamin K epoxide reductase [Actinomycetota bacterium]|nr:vitamin K epoxide reductase [Actinomycetota bacterium]
MAPDIRRPPGWESNPSAWNQRLPIVGVALVGFAIATYLTLFQYGVVDAVWEPFFGNGSVTVLESRLSRVLPVSDAALGAAGYLADAVSGALFGVRRWRTHPWIVVIFGVAIGPLGLVSVLLVIAQPVLFSSFCTLCLASAVISLAMIPPAVDEVLASLQRLRRVQLAGGSVWQAFWGLDREAVQARAEAGRS